MTLEEAHRLAREKGASRPIYWIVRTLVAPFLRIWYGLRIFGAEHVPATGAAIIAPNHKSLYDSFFIGMATRRHLRFMGKSELFAGPSGWLLVRLGAFPVRRDEADPEALETARVILRQGGLLSLFPEGTRFREPATLTRPRRGAARIAIETGAPLVPCAITGTEQLFWGPFPRPRRVQVSFAAPVSSSELEATPAAAAELIEEGVWPHVEREFGRLLARPGAIAAALAALGVTGGLAYRSRRAPRATGLRRVLPRRRRRRRGAVAPLSAAQMPSRRRNARAPSTPAPSAPARSASARSEVATRTAPGSGSAARRRTISSSAASRPRRGAITTATPHASVASSSGPASSTTTSSSPVRPA